MTIAVPSEGKELGGAVSRSFGRTPYFLIVDPDTLDFKVLDNGAASEQGGAGIKAAQSIADCAPQAVVTFHCGENAADVLKAAGIRILKAVPGTVGETAEKYKRGELSELSEIHAGYHGSGGR